MWLIRGSDRQREGGGIDIKGGLGLGMSIIAYEDGIFFAGLEYGLNFLA